MKGKSHKHFTISFLWDTFNEYGNFNPLINMCSDNTSIFIIFNVVHFIVMTGMVHLEAAKRNKRKKRRKI